MTSYPRRQVGDGGCDAVVGCPRGSDRASDDPRPLRLGDPLLTSAPRAIAQSVDADGVELVQPAARYAEHV